MGTVLKKVRWTDVLAFLSRLDLISLCATNREYSEICSLIFHGIRRDDVEDKNDHNVKDLRIRWNRANNENKIEVGVYFFNFIRVCRKRCNKIISGLERISRWI